MRWGMPRTSCSRRAGLSRAGGNRARSASRSTHLTAIPGTSPSPRPGATSSSGGLDLGPPCVSSAPGRAAGAEAPESARALAATPSAASFPYFAWSASPFFQLWCDSPLTSPHSDASCPCLERAGGRGHSPLREVLLRRETPSPRRGGGRGPSAQRDARPGATALATAKACCAARFA